MKTFKIGVAILTAVVLLPVAAFSQNKLAGAVADESTGEKIAGAIVTVENSFSMGTTDSHGNFTISGLKNDQVKIHIAHLAYKDTFLIVNLPSAPVLIQLKQRTILADEVNIVATRAGNKSAMT